MKILFALALAVTVAACGGRQVEVQTGPAPTSDVAIHLTNNASQPVRVYVVSGGQDNFVAEVSSNSTQHLPVTGVASGSVVTLKATTADGSRTYTRDNVTLSGTVPWQVP